MISALSHSRQIFDRLLKSNSDDFGQGALNISISPSRGKCWLTLFNLQQNKLQRGLIGLIYLLIGTIMCRYQAEKPALSYKAIAQMDCKLSKGCWSSLTYYDTQKNLPPIHFVLNQNICTFDNQEFCFYPWCLINQQKLNEFSRICISSSLGKNEQLSGSIEGPRHEVI